VGGDELPLELLPPPPQDERSAMALSAAPKRLKAAVGLRPLPGASPAGMTVIDVHPLMPKKVQGNERLNILCLNIGCKAHSYCTDDDLHAR
jgi:hypothetical protein